MFKVNQKVWCAIYGAGVVTEILHASEGTYPVVALFKDTRLAAYTSDGKYSVDGNVTLFPYPVEIVKAIAKPSIAKPSIAKPSIDWSHVNEDFQWLAMDDDGECYIYSGKPSRGGQQQWVSNLRLTVADHFASFTPGTCDWKDSLVKRPN